MCHDDNCGWWHDALERFDHRRHYGSVHVAVHDLDDQGTGDHDHDVANHHHNAADDNHDQADNDNDGRYDHDNEADNDHDDCCDHHNGSDHHDHDRGACAISECERSIYQVSIWRHDGSHHLGVEHRQSCCEQFFAYLHALARVGVRSETSWLSRAGRQNKALLHYLHARLPQ